MQPRIPNPGILLPEVMQALIQLGAVAKKDYGVPERTLSLMHLRASQINGCSVCVDMHARSLQHTGETNERLIAVGAWRDAPYFTDAERAALALTEAATRLADRSDPVPDAPHRHDQPLEPPQRPHPPGSRRVAKIRRSPEVAAATKRTAARTRRGITTTQQQSGHRTQR
jgi:AhpD family alkylhydroperoxidase